MHIKGLKSAISSDISVNFCSTSRALGPSTLRPVYASVTSRNVTDPSLGRWRCIQVAAVVCATVGEMMKNLTMEKAMLEISMIEAVSVSSIDAILCDKSQQKV